LIVDNDFSL